MDLRVSGFLFFIDRIAAYVKKGTCGDIPKSRGRGFVIAGVKFGVPRGSNPQSEIASLRSQ